MDCSWAAVRVDRELRLFLVGSARVWGMIVEARAKAMKVLVKCISAAERV